MRALVTGGAGFIGSHVVEALAARGHEVEVLDNLSSGDRANVPADIPLHAVDVLSEAAACVVREVAFDVVFHLAGQVGVRKSMSDPLFDAQSNVLGTINIAEAIGSLPPSRRPRIVFASTAAAAYGPDAPLPTTEDVPPAPTTPYGIAKLASEHYLAYFARARSIDTVILRSANAYGPRQCARGEAGVIAIFAHRIARDEPVVVYGNGRQTRDFIYVADVAEAFVAAVTRPVSAAGPAGAMIFNVGTGIETPILDIAHRLGEIAGRTPRLEFSPAAPGEVERSCLSGRKAGEHLGWRPRVDLRSGLAETYRWVTCIT